jgi:AcrR family transcriptional regulator
MPTQAERRASTRRALLDAAAAVLVDDGTAGFTTTAVTARAELSNGALFGHFPSRLDLLAATVEHVLVRLRDDYDRTFAGLEHTPEPSTALELLWSAMSDEQFAAVLELYTQARTDDELLAAIHPVVAEHGEYVRGLVGRVAAALAGDDADTRRRLAEVGNLAILAMQGAVVGRMAGAATGAERDLLDLCTRLADREIRS